MNYEKEIEKYKHRLYRLIDQRDKLLEQHKDKELNYTYWGGYELGYLKGRISEIEDILDILNNM